MDTQQAETSFKVLPDFPYCDHGMLLTINERNKTRRLEYPWLFPSRISKNNHL